MEVKSNAGYAKRILAILLVFGPAFILIFIATRSCSHNFKELDDYGVADNYAFIDAQGSQAYCRRF